MVLNDGDGEGTHKYPTIGGLESVNNAVYNTTGIAGVQAEISSVGYATFSSTQDVDFTTVTSITAQKGHVESNGRITRIPSTSWASAHKLKAGEGVLLQGAAGTYTIPIAASASTDSSNDLKAIDVKQKLDQSADGKTHYILTTQTTSGTSTLGFYKVNASGSWCKAGTAYLATTYNPSSARGYFPLWDEDTAVDYLVIDAEKTNSPVYDLQGRRVANPQKGLYIVNSKKVIIK